jgi:hypothetical protein
MYLSIALAISQIAIQHLALRTWATLLTNDSLYILLCTMRVTFGLERVSSTQGERQSLVIFSQEIVDLASQKCC